MYSFLLGILIGMMIIRMELSSKVFFHSWGEKALNYVAIPSIMFLTYMGIMYGVKVEWSWSIHFIIGNFTGIILQLIMIRYRRRYVRQLLNLEERERHLE